MPSSSATPALLRWCGEGRWSSLDKAAALALLKSLGATPEQIAASTKTGEPSTALQIKPKLALAVLMDGAYGPSLPFSLMED